MSLYQKASLVQIPSGYKASGAKLYSVLPANGNGDFTISADADATRVNSDGLVESTAANQARLNYDPTNPQDPHLLLEPARTNILLTTTDVDIFDNRANITDTPNTTTAPDGSLTADTLSIAASGSSFLYDNITVTASTEYAFSFYVKNINFTGSQGLYAIYNNSGSSFIVQNVAYNITSEWVRITGTFTTPSGCTSIRVYPFRNGIGTGNFSIWGWQLEAGTYATSYIPTALSTVTRTVDSAQKLNQTLFTDYPFTVYAKASLDAIGNTIFSLNNTSSQNYYLAFYFPNSTQVGLLRRDLSTNDSDFYSFSSSVGTTYKIAVAFVSATAYKLYIDGTQIANITSGGSIPFNHDDISLGQFRITGDTATRNSIDEFMVFNEALTDSELQTLTS